MSFNLLFSRNTLNPLCNRLQTISYFRSSTACPIVDRSLSVSGKLLRRRSGLERSKSIRIGDSKRSLAGTGRVWQRKVIPPPPPVMRISCRAYLGSMRFLILTCDLALIRPVCRGRQRVQRNRPTNSQHMNIIHPHWISALKIKFIIIGAPSFPCAL